MFSSSHQTLIVVAIALTLVFAVPMKAQDQVQRTQEGQDDEDQPQDYLDVHNQARAAVGVSPIKWNNTLVAYATNYANLRRGDCTLIHSNYNDPGYGENLAMSTGDLSGAESVRLWVSEEADYDYSSNSCNIGQQCGHYTQVVWRNTESVGCAKVTCDNGGTFVTCNYSPPGNWVGEWPY